MDEAWRHYMHSYANANELQAIDIHRKDTRSCLNILEWRGEKTYKISIN
jgi:hypothetical protein